MGIVSLEGMEFFSYHGFYDAEQQLGNKYAIDIAIHADLSVAALSDELRATINYETVYKLIAQIMQQKHRLLEHVAHQIIDAVRSNFTGVEKVVVQVSKFNPPLGGICERSRITLEG